MIIISFSAPALQPADGPNRWTNSRRESRVALSFALLGMRPISITIGQFFVDLTFSRNRCRWDEIATNLLSRSSGQSFSFETMSTERIEDFPIIETLVTQTPTDFTEIRRLS